MAKHNETGKKGEEIALSFLLEKGFKVLETNWRVKKAEVDIIIQKDNTIIFVEVKTRSTDFFGQPEEFVNDKKQQLMVDAAQIYIEKIQHEGEIRFDIISILLNNKKYTINHFEDAFFPYY